MTHKIRVLLLTVAVALALMVPAAAFAAEGQGDQAAQGQATEQGADQAAEQAAEQAAKQAPDQENASGEGTGSADQGQAAETPAVAVYDCGKYGHLYTNLVCNKLETSLMVGACPFCQTQVAWGCGSETHEHANAAVATYAWYAAVGITADGQGAILGVSDASASVPADAAALLPEGYLDALQKAGLSQIEAKAKDGFVSVLLVGANQDGTFKLLSQRLTTSDGYTVINSNPRAFFAFGPNSFVRIAKGSGSLVTLKSEGTDASVAINGVPFGVVEKPVAVEEQPAPEAAEPEAAEAADAAPAESEQAEPEAAELAEAEPAPNEPDAVLQHFIVKVKKAESGALTAEIQNMKTDESLLAVPQAAVASLEAIQAAAEQAAAEQAAAEQQAADAAAAAEAQAAEPAAEAAEPEPVPEPAAEPIVPEHGFVLNQMIENATCQQGGLEYDACDQCGLGYITRTQVIDHVWSDVFPTQEATCTEDGAGYHLCYLCGLQEDVVIPALGHTVIVDEAVAPTCTEDGLTEGSHCDVCAAVLEPQEVAPATGHSFSDWEVVAEGNCTEDHVEKHVCQTCGEEETSTMPAPGHQVAEWTAVKAPSCTEDGLYEGVCSVCQQNATLTAEAFGHQWSEWVITDPASCIAVGKKTHSCSVCGAEESEEIPLVDHTAVIDPAVAATCEKAGKTQGSHCSVCEKVLVEQTIISALGHDWSDTIIDTSTKPVTVYEYCKRDGCTARKYH